MYYPCYQPKQRWQSSHIYVKELLKLYRLLNESNLSVENLYDAFSVGQIHAIRALRTVYGFPPVSQNGDYDIDILEPCMDFHLYQALLTIVSYESKYQYSSVYGSYVDFDGQRANTSDIKDSSNLYFKIKSERLKLLSSYINLLEEVFFQLYLEESYDELSYYSPFEELVDDSDIVDCVIQAGVCKSKDEVLSTFGKIRDDGTIELVVNFFDKKYPQFDDYAEKLIKKYAKGDHVQYFYSETSEVDQHIR